MENKTKRKLAYLAPKIFVEQVEMEQGIAAGSADINTGRDSQTPREREWDSNWSNGKDFDI
ncbi:hypothetical protein [Sphingobacterium sp.]|uniref:hypothetical protein n=1 Tax=Sphingobacterium sp. TaxID=341027 RepID=UPI0025884487|nr:hypothetical protein [Sphingobacterium sp.]WET68613.1 MAG: hypothetical protein P0Y57_22515 [Sphingobacterium sp.]